MLFLCSCIRGFSDVQAQVQFNEKLFLFTDRFNKRLYATSSIFEAVGIWIHIGALHIEKLKIAHKTIGRASLLLLFSIYVASTIIGTMAKAPEEFTKPDWVIHFLHASVSVIHGLLIVNPEMSPVYFSPTTISQADWLASGSSSS